MKILSEPNNKFINEQEKKDNCKYRFNRYLLRYKYREYIVLYNFFNDGFVIVSEDEYNKILEDFSNNSFFIRNWFIVPNDFNEYKMAVVFRKRVQSKPLPKFETIGSYTIMTTTDCNAQCYYCYEFGRKKIHMTEKIANDVADYIIKKYNGKQVKLGWFGGEPLYNEKVIDIITTKLKENNINYYSTMISNGYLFDENKKDKYKNLWKLKSIQITLDGINQEYNDIKNYIYDDEVNAFEKVTNNILFLTKNEIKVNIRLNVSSLNKDSLLSLIDFCFEKYGKQKYFSMYAHNIFDEEKSNDEELLKNIYKNLEEVDNKIIEKFGLISNYRKKISKTVCMANSGNSIVINPWGKIGLCEHYSESEYIGGIYEDNYDEDAIRCWNERMEEDMCKQCPFYPACYRLKKCENNFCNNYKKNIEIKKFKRILNKKIYNEVIKNKK